jgi:predicted GNAT family N-acyltransferase
MKFTKHPNNLIVRKALPGDEAGIHQAHMRSINEVCVKDHGKDEIKGWGNRPLGDRWIRPIQDGHVWVVESDHTIYGLGYLKVLEKENVKSAYLHALYLTPEILGMKFGYKLTKLMLKTASDFGAKEITLDSSITAHDFYKRMGFIDNGPMKFHEIGGIPVRCFPMIKKLNDL